MGIGLDLCHYIEKNDIDDNTARKLVAYAALELIESGEYKRALVLLRNAKARGVFDPRLESLENKLDTMISLRNSVEAISADLQILSDYLAKGIIDYALLVKLENGLTKLEEIIRRANQYGLRVDEQFINYASEFVSILRTIWENKELVDNTLEFINSFTKDIERILSSSTSIESLVSGLRYLGAAYAGAAARLIQELDSAVAKLHSLSVTTNASNIRDMYLTQYEALTSALRMINWIASVSRVLSVWLDNVNKGLREAYEDPEASPFGSKRQSFINSVASILSESKALRDRLYGVASPYGASGGLRELINGLQSLGDALYKSMLVLLRNMKYSTTFNDYRWNSIWEAAEARAGVNLGEIGKADVQRYEFKYCDLNGCKLEKRSGIIGEIVENVPDELLVFWTSAEEALNAIEQYNRWAMNYASNPLIKIAGHLGYIGANIIMAVGGLFAPRLLAEQVNAIAQLAGEWKDAVLSGSMKRVSDAAGKTWDMFFGSREAALATLAGILLGTAIMRLAMRGLPTGARMPITRAVTANLVQGDIIGAGLVLVERMAPVARVQGAARTLVTSGRINLAQIVDDAGLLDRITARAGRVESIKTMVGMDTFRDIVKKALKDSESFEDAHKRLVEALQIHGLDKLAGATTEFRAVKATVISNLASMQVYAPTKFNRVRNSVKRLLHRDIPEEELPRLVRQDISSVKSAQKLYEIADAIASNRGRTLVEKAATSKVVSQDTLHILNVIDEVASYYRSLGMGATANVLKLLRDRLEALAGEVERLADIKMTLDTLEEIRKLGESANLWKDTVVLNKRRFKPSRDWLKKQQVSLDTELKQLRSNIETAYDRKVRMKVELESSLANLREKLEEGEKITIQSIAEALADAFRRAGLEDLANDILREVERATPDMGRVPIAIRVSRVLEGYANRIMDRVYESLLKLDEIDEAVALSNPAFKASGLPAPLAKAYMAGLKAAKTIADSLLNISNVLKSSAMEAIRGAETRLAKKMASLIDEQYRQASLENLAFLKGLKKGLEAYDKTPIAALLNEIDGALSRTLEAIEVPLSEQIANLRLREQAYKNLEALLGPAGPIDDILVKLGKQLDKTAQSMTQILEEYPAARPVLQHATRMLDAGEDVVSALAEAREYARRAGIEVPEPYWKALEDYIYIRDTVKSIEELIESISDKTPLRLEDVQTVIDKIAKVDVDAAIQTDWALVKAYLGELANHLETTREQIARFDANLSRRIESIQGGIQRIIEASPRDGPFTKIVDILELKRTSTSLIEGMEQLYTILERGLGKGKLVNLRKLIDDFKSKLEKGEFDTETLKKINSELRKLKIKNLPGSLTADLRRLANWLNEKAIRITGGKEAAEIQKAINRLADEIKRMEEQMIVEEGGWVGLDRIIEVSEARFVRVPVEYAEHIAKILHEREKSWQFKTREGYTIIVNRRIEVTPTGEFKILYTIEFPGGRRIWFGEVNRASGKRVETARTTGYDPPVSHAIQAYKQAKKGLRDMDELARQGKTILDLLDEGPHKIDPDYEIIRRIAILTDDGLETLGRRLDSAVRNLVQTLTATLPPTAHQILEERQDATRKTTPFTETIDKNIFENIEEAIQRLQAGISKPDDEILLALTLPIVARIRPLYDMIVEMDAGEIADLVPAIKKRIGPIVGGGRLPPDHIENIVPLAPFTPKDVEEDKIIVVLPEPGEDVLGYWRSPDYAIEIKLPDGFKWKMPGYSLDPITVVLLPPIAIEVPDDLRRVLEYQPPPVEKPPQPVTPPPPGYTPLPGLPAPPVPTPMTPSPIIPVIPWGGGRGYGVRREERERLQI